MVRTPTDGGGGDPLSAYDYTQIPSPDLENLLTTPVAPIQALVQSWQSFAGHMDSILTQQGMSLAAASQKLTGWSGQASDAFTKRLQQVIDLGTQIKTAAITTGESFVESGQSFHVATNSLTYSMKDMNTWGEQVINAQPVWCEDILTITQYLLTREPNEIQYHVNPNRYYIMPYDGPVSDLTNKPVPYYKFMYAYGEGLPGVVIFNGDIHPYESATLTSTTNGVYPDESLSISWNGMSAIPLSVDDIAKHFPNTYRNQLQQMLSQVGGSLYHPQVGKFPGAPKPAWSDSSGQQNGGPGTGGPNGGPGSFGGLGGGSGGLNGVGTGTGGLGGSGGGSGGGPGGGSGGTGSGGAPGGGSGGFGSGGAPGGGSGGFGSGGAPGGPGGTGGGGLPGGGGTTKIAGVGPGGPSGGLGPLGGGLGPGGGIGGLTAGGPGSGGLGGLGGTGALGGAADGALAGAAGTTGSALPIMPPMMPPMMGGAGQNDNSRQRKSWLPDDEEIWGDAGTAVPPVISSDG